MAAVRRDEFLEATSALGLDLADLVMLGFEDASLTRSESRLRGAVEDVVAGFRPDVVMSPCPWDIHPDHAALGRVARAVLDGRPVQHVEYLIWGWDQPVRLAARLGRRLRGLRDDRTTAGRPARLGRRLRGLRDDRTTAGRPVLVNGTGHVAKKAEALACYTTQFAPSAELYGHSIGGSGPLGNEFLRQIDFENELFFPRRAHKAAAPVEGRSPG
jgi:LmbE family N-acetylglucosaminyl deacetylase